MGGSTVVSIFISPRRLNHPVSIQLLSPLVSGDAHYITGTLL